MLNSSKYFIQINKNFNRYFITLSNYELDSLDSFFVYHLELVVSRCHLFYHMNSNSSNFKNIEAFFVSKSSSSISEFIIFEKTFKSTSKMSNIDSSSVDVDSSNLNTTLVVFISKSLVDRIFIVVLTNIQKLNKFNDWQKWNRLFMKLIKMQSLWNIFINESDNFSDFIQQQLICMLHFVCDESAVVILKLHEKKSAIFMYQKLKQAYDTSIMSFYAKIFFAVLHEIQINHSSLRNYYQSISKTKNRLIFLNQKMSVWIRDSCFIHTRIELVIRHLKTNVSIRLCKKFSEWKKIRRIYSQEDNATSWKSESRHHVWCHE